MGRAGIRYLSMPTVSGTRVGAVLPRPRRCIVWPRGSPVCGSSRRGLRPTRTPPRSQAPPGLKLRPGLDHRPQAPPRPRAPPGPQLRPGPQAAPGLSSARASSSAGRSSAPGCRHAAHRRYLSFSQLQVHRVPPIEGPRPYRSYSDDLADTLGAALEAAGIGFRDAIERVAAYRGELTFHVRRGGCPRSRRTPRRPGAAPRLCCGVSGVHYPDDTGRTARGFHLLSMTHNRGSGSR